MKRLLMLIAALLGGLALVGCVDDTEVADAVEVFCTDNPDALICQNPEATRDALVADMFNTIMTEFVAGDNPDFCADYFDDSTLIETCRTDRFALVPDDIATLGDNLVIQALSTTNEFEVLTEDADGNPAYRFVVRVTEREGLLRFNRFEFETITVEEPTVDELEIKMLMNTMINDQDSAMAYCDEYFTTAGKQDCLDDVVQPAFFMYQPIVTHLGGLRYTYSVKTYDGFDEMIYTIELAMEDGDTLKIDAIAVEHRPAYNTLAHAHTLMTDTILYQFNRANGGAYSACGYIVDDDEATCRERLLPFDGETMTISSYGPGDTTEQHAFTLAFDSGTLTVQVEVVLDEYHNYELDFTWGVVSEDPTMELTALFEQYLNDLMDPNKTVQDMTYLMEGFYVDYQKENISWYDAITLEDLTILEEQGDVLYVELVVAFDFDESFYRDDMVRTFVEKVEKTADGFLIPPISYYPMYRDHTYDEALDLLQRMFDAYYDGSIEYDEYLMNEQGYELSHYNDILANPSLLFPSVEPTELILLEVPNINGYYALVFRYEDDQGRSYYMPPFIELDVSYEDGDHKVLATYSNDWDDSVLQDIVQSWLADFTNPAMATSAVCANVQGIGFDCVSVRAAALAGSASATGRMDDVMTGVRQPYLQLDVDGTTYDFQLNLSLYVTTPWGYRIASLDFQNPSVSYTIDMVQDRLDQMIQDQEDGIFQCDAFFTGSAISVCQSRQSDLIPSVNTPLLTVEAGAILGTFVVYPYDYNGEADGYTQQFPVYQIRVEVSTGTLMFDELTFFTEPSIADYEALAATWWSDVLDSTMSDATFCETYRFPAYHAFHELMPCDHFRQMLLEEQVSVQVDVRMGANPYGATIPILSVVVGDVSYEFEMAVRFHDADTMVLRTLWYILFENEEGVTLDDVALAKLDFEATLLDDTLDSTTFCTSYPLLADCVAWRDELLVASDVIISFIGGIAADGTSDLLRFTVDASGDMPVIDSVSGGSGCICDDTTCDWTILVHTIANEALWRRFIDDYNNPDIDDATLANTYFGGVSNALLDSRSSLIGTLRLQDVSTHWEEGVFVDAGVVLTSTSIDTIIAYDIRFVATTPMEGHYLITVSSLDTVSSLSLLDATTLYTEYLSDYLDYNVSNDSLKATYFATDPGLLFDDRMSFLFAGGTITLDDVTLGEDGFLARYTVVSQGIETTYEQTFFAHGDETMSFLSRRVLGSVLREASTTEAEASLVDLFTDLSDSTSSIDAICATYFAGMDPCPFDGAGNPTGTIYSIQSITTDETQSPMLHTVVYTKQVFGISYEVTESFQVLIADDGRVQMASLGRTSSLDSTIPMASSNLDLSAQITYINQFFADYFDNTIDSVTFCQTHRYLDDILLHMEEQSGIPSAEQGRHYCEYYREMNFLYGAHLDITNVTFEGVYRHYDGTPMYAFFLIAHGYYTMSSDAYEGLDYDYSVPIFLHPNAQMPGGFQAQFDALAYQPQHPLSASEVEDFVAREASFLTSPGRTATDVCNRYDVYTPGHACFLDQASVSGWTIQQVDHRVATRRVNPIGASYLLSVDLLITYQDPQSGAQRTITIPLDVEVDWLYSANAFVIYDDPSDYRVRYTQIAGSLDYDALLAMANAYVVAYFDSSMSTADFVTLYQNGNDLGGEMSFFRTTDQGYASTSPSVLDVALMPYGSDLPPNVHRVYVFIQDGDVVHPAYLLYVEPDGGTPGYFRLESYLIHPYLASYDPQS
jgi:hypothetical protein